MANYPIYQIGSYVLDETNGVILQDADPDSSTPLGLDIQDVARRPGGKLISATLQTKKIPLKGSIIGSSWADLNNKLDAFKAACVGTYLPLDVDDGIRCIRYYVSTDGSAIFNRSGKIVHADFSISLRAVDPPFGQDATRGGTLVTTTALNDTGVTLDIYTPNPVTFLGTAPPAAKVTITVVTAGDLTSLEFVDVTNSRTLSITPSGAMATGDVIKIDTSVPSVTLNNQPVAFSGVFPNFNPGASQIAVYAYTSTGLILDQSQKLGNSDRLLYTTTQVVAEAWTTSATAGPLSRIQFQASKVGNPSSPITVTIKADNGSGTAPSGTALATATVPASAVSSIIQYLTASINSLPSLAASTKYWMLFTVGAGCDLDNYYLIRTYSNTPKGYANGGAFVSSNSGTSFTAIASTDLVFKTYRSVQGAKNDVLDAGSANSVTENFSTNTRKDTTGGVVTADWNNAGPYLSMNGVSATPTDDFTGTGFDWNGDGCHFCDAPFFKFTVPGPAGASVKMNSLTFYAKKYAGNADISVSLRSAYNNSTALYYASATATNTGYTAINLTGLNWNVVAGQTYWVGFYFTLESGAVQGVQGTGAAGSFSGSSNVVMLTDWERNSPSFAGTWQYSGAAGIRHSIGFSYTDLSTAEKGQTLELASTVADIISTSQVTTTILLGGSTYQGAVSADNGTNFTNIVRDNAAFDTENVPTVIGNQLKMRWTLQNPTGAIKPYVTNSILYWRKGIALDASTERGAQLFTQPSTGNLARADLYVRKIGAPGDLIIDIYSDTAGSPGTLLGTATITASGITANVWGWVPGNLSSAISVTATLNYWIVPRSSTLDNANKWLVLANNNGYAGASKRSANSGSSWSSITSNEKLLFRTYGTAGNNFAYNTKIDYVKAYL